MRASIGAGLEWAKVAEKVVLYTDLGITEGMATALSRATVRNIPVVYRNGIWQVG